MAFSLLAAGMRYKNHMMNHSHGTESKDRITITVPMVKNSKGNWGKTVKTVECKQIIQADSTQFHFHYVAFDRKSSLGE